MPYKVVLPLPLVRIDPLPDEIENTLDLELLIDRRVRAEGDCLLWTGNVNQGGIPIIASPNDKTLSLSVHRLQYTRHRGPIADALTVGTSCLNKRCLEPDHLLVRNKRWVWRELREKRERDRVKTGG